jgi:hypothetical protein
LKEEGIRIVEEQKCSTQGEGGTLRGTTIFYTKNENLQVEFAVEFTQKC